MDTESLDDELLVKDAYNYITRKIYPDGCSANRKRVIRKKALKFSVSENGELLYRHKQKGKVYTLYSLSHTCIYISGAVIICIEITV